jgi:hypothetical protein
VAAGETADQRRDEHRQRDEHDDGDAERETEPEGAAGRAMHALARLELGELHLVRDEALGIVGEPTNQIGDPGVRVG